MFDCFGVRFVPPILEKEPNFQNGQKKPEKWDKHGHNFIIFSQVSGQT